MRLVDKVVLEEAATGLEVGVIEYLVYFALLILLVYIVFMSKKRGSQDVKEETE